MASVSLAETESAPTGPGVYRFWSSKGQILYVGKAANLRKRLAQYRSGREAEQRINIALLLRQADQVDWIQTGTEKEALLLENVQIKEHLPRYNIRMRDDKSYLYLRITVEHPFPRLVRVRRPKPGLRGVYGPYPSALVVKRIQDVARRILPLRTCTDHKFANRSRACLEHQIGRCSAPCVGKIKSSDYAPLVEDLTGLLTGESRALRKTWQQRMMQASAVMAYEEAARYRDLIQAIEQIAEKQVFELHEGTTTDVVGIAVAEGKAAIILLGVAAGTVISRRAFGPFAFQGDEGSLFSQFLLQYYSGDRVIPAMISLSTLPEDQQLLVEILGERRGKKIVLRHARRGPIGTLVRLACRQAQETLSVDGGTLARLEAVARLLHLPEPPRRVECFDISEHHGDAPVGGNQVFLFGESAPELSRRYKLERTGSENDFAHMYAMFVRRIHRAIREGDMPDLIVVDGGKGQLSSVSRAFSDLEVEPPALVGLAKARNPGDTSGQERSFERLFLPGRSNPLLLKPGSAAMLFFVDLRDRTHNLAVGYHRKRHSDELLSGIEQIPGIGPKRRNQLRQAYRNLGDLAYATADEVSEKATLPLTVAEDVVQWMQDSDIATVHDSDTTET